MRPDGHVFAARLRGAALDLAPVRAAWSGLSDDDLRELGACLPKVWVEAEESVVAALTHVRTVRDRIDECLTEMERALT